MSRVIGICFCILLTCKYGYFSIYREISVLKDRYITKYKIMKLTGCCMTAEKCAIECQKFSGCNGYFFNEVTDQCQLQYVAIDTSNVFVEEIGWRYFCRLEEYIANIETSSYQQVNLLSYCIDVADKSALIFRVKGCKDAIITLTPFETSNSSKSYEIILGAFGNTKSEINVNYSPVSEHNNSVMDCFTYKAFWVGWENGTITVGTGNQVGNNTFLKWEDKSSINVALAYISCYDRTNNWIFEL